MGVEVAIQAEAVPFWRPGVIPGHRTSQLGTSHGSGSAPGARAGLRLLELRAGDDR